MILCDTVTVEMCHDMFAKPIERTPPGVKPKGSWTLDDYDVSMQVYQL